jgi:hypothetical protein
MNGGMKLSSATCSSNAREHLVVFNILLAAELQAMITL